jgi:uncharacterized membrane protein YesL
MLPDHSVEPSRPLLIRLMSDVYNWLVPLTAINILWFLMSLTIILLPPATAGLFHVAYRVTRSEGPTIQEFFAGIRQWFWISWIWGLMVGVFLGVSALALIFYSASATPIGSVLFAITAVLVAFFLLTQAFFFPYILLQEKPVIRIALRNALFTILADPLRMLIHGIILLLVVIISVLLVFPFVVLTPVTIAFWLMYLLLDWLKRHELLR